MSPEIIAAIVLLGSLLFLLAIGLEIAWAIAWVAGIGLVVFINQPLNQFAWSSFASLNSFALTAVPLFIFMSSIIAKTGISEYMFDAVDKWIGRLPGGLADSVIVGNAVLGAMCGSSIAATATFGKIAIPAMEKRNYDPGLALGSVAVGAILSPLIPPGILLIIYGTWQGLSIVALFAAALVPGIMLAILFIITIVIRVKINPRLVPPPPEVSWRERLIAIRGILPFAVLILGVLGVIFGGVMTPTEAAAMGAFLSLVLTLAYRRLNLAILKASLLDTVKVSCMALFILAMAIVLAFVFNITGIISLVTTSLLGLEIGKYGILAIFLVMYLILGMFMTSWEMLFITFPFVMPVIIGTGINPIWWGVIYVMAGEQCLVTPPFGMGLFVLQSVCPQYSMETIVRGSLPFLIPIYINIVILTAFPQVVLWLPNLLLG